MVQVIIIVDETGSMSSNKATTISAYNEFLDGQRQAATDDETANDVTNFTLVKFNTITTFHEMADIKDAPPLTERNYKPGKCTALYDALGKTFKKYKDESENICVVITDGEDNCSQEFHCQQIKDMTKDLTDNKNWIFQYLAANQDAFAVGQSMGISRTMDFQMNRASITNAYSSVSSEVQLQRGYQQTVSKSRLSGSSNVYESFDHYRRLKSDKVYEKMGTVRYNDKQNDDSN